MVVEHFNIALNIYDASLVAPVPNNPEATQNLFVKSVDRPMLLDLVKGLPKGIARQVYLRMANATSKPFRLRPRARLSLEIHELSDWNRHLSTPRPNFLHSQIGRLQQRLIALRQAIVFYCMGPVLQPQETRLKDLKVTSLDDKKGKKAKETGTDDEETSKKKKAAGRKKKEDKEEVNQREETKKQKKKKAARSTTEEDEDSEEEKPKGKTRNKNDDKKMPRKKTATKAKEEEDEEEVSEEEEEEPPTPKDSKKKRPVEKEKGEAQKKKEGKLKKDSEKKRRVEEEHDEAEEDQEEEKKEKPKPKDSKPEQRVEDEVDEAKDQKKPKKTTGKADGEDEEDENPKLKKDSKKKRRVEDEEDEAKDQKKPKKTAGKADGEDEEDENPKKKDSKKKRQVEDEDDDEEEGCEKLLVVLPWNFWCWRRSLGGAPFHVLGVVFCSRLWLLAKARSHSPSCHKTWPGMPTRRHLMFRRARDELCGVLKREAVKEAEYRAARQKHEEEVRLGFGATDMTKEELKKLIDSDRRMYYRSEELNDKLFIQYKGWKELKNLEGWTRAGCLLTGLLCSCLWYFIA
eukprot:g29393.t1